MTLSGPFLKVGPLGLSVVLDHLTPAPGIPRSGFLPLLYMVGVV
jgi:hypothetical protein